MIDPLWLIGAVAVGYIACFIKRGADSGAAIDSRVKQALDDVSRPFVEHLEITRAQQKDGHEQEN